MRFHLKFRFLAFPQRLEDVEMLDSPLTLSSCWVAAAPLSWDVRTPVSLVPAAPVFYNHLCSLLGPVSHLHSQPLSSFSSFILQVKKLGLEGGMWVSRPRTTSWTLLRVLLSLLSHSCLSIEDWKGIHQATWLTILPAVPASQCVLFAYICGHMEIRTHSQEDQDSALWISPLCEAPAQVSKVERGLNITGKIKSGQLLGRAQPLPCGIAGRWGAR